MYVFALAKTQLATDAENKMTYYKIESVMKSNSGVVTLLVRCITIDG